ncbi:hypothetical protein KIPB_003459, partial [Kipferlia bialata]|eukprot:g3459.t1
MGVMSIPCLSLLCSPECGMSDTPSEVASPAPKAPFRLVPFVPGEPEWQVLDGGEEGGTDDAETVEEALQWKRTGNMSYAKHKYPAAVDSYTQGLEVLE